MYASKEQARLAQETLVTITNQVEMSVFDDEARERILKNLGVVREFVKATVRRLPTEASYIRDKSRTRTV